MRTALGFVAANGLLMLVGFALLYATGLVEPRLRSALAGGLALLAGAALFGITAVLFLTVGIPLALPTELALAAGWIAVLVGVGFGLRARGRIQPITEPVREPLAIGFRIVGIGLAVLIGGVVLLACVTNFSVGVGWDAAHHWTYKAATLFWFDHLPNEVFNNPTRAWTTALNYPILQPTLMSFLFRAEGGLAVGMVPAELWLLVGALVAAAGWLIGRRARGLLWLVPAALVIPAAGSVIMLSDADPLVWTFIALGALCIGLWVQRRHWGLIVLAGIAIGAGANVKNEGMAAALLVWVAAGVLVLLARNWRLLLPIATGAVITGLAVLPWRIWLTINRPPSNQPLGSIGQVLTPDFLPSRLHNLHAGSDSIVALLTNAERYKLVPIALVVIVGACLVTKKFRSLAGFYGIAATLLFGLLLWTYWTVTAVSDLPGFINVTADRIVLGVVFVAALGSSHLLATVIGARESIEVDEGGPVESRGTDSPVLQAR